LTFVLTVNCFLFSDRLSLRDLLDVTVLLRDAEDTLMNFTLFSARTHNCPLDWTLCCKKSRKWSLIIDRKIL